MHRESSGKQPGHLNWLLTHFPPTTDHCKWENGLGKCRGRSIWHRNGPLWLLSDAFSSLPPLGMGYFSVWTLEKSQSILLNMELVLHFAMDGKETRFTRSLPFSTHLVMRPFGSVLATTFQDPVHCYLQTMDKEFHCLLGTNEKWRHSPVSSEHWWQCGPKWFHVDVK